VPISVGFFYKNNRFTIPLFLHHIRPHLTPRGGFHGGTPRIQAFTRPFLIQEAAATRVSPFKPMHSVGKLYTQPGPDSPEIHNQLIRFIN